MYLDFRDAIKRNIGGCEAVCPKSIKLEVIARMNRDYLKASWTARGEAAPDGE